MSFYWDQLLEGIFKEKEVNGDGDRFYTDNFYYGGKEHLDYNKNYYVDSNYIQDNKF